MTPAKRAATAAGVLAVLILAALYLPSPVSAVAAAILGLFVLLLVLPLILTAIVMVSAFLSLSDDEGGLFESILDAWFLWGALDLLWEAGSAQMAVGGNEMGVHAPPASLNKGRWVGEATVQQRATIVTVGRKDYPVGSRPVSCPNNADTQLRCRAAAGSSSTGSPTTTTVRAAIS